MVQCPEKHEGKTVQLCFLTDQRKNTVVTANYFEFPIKREHMDRSLKYPHAKWCTLTALNGQVVLALRIYSHSGSITSLPDLILNGLQLPSEAANSVPPNHCKLSIRRFLVEKRALPSTSQGVQAAGEPPSDADREKQNEPSSPADSMIKNETCKGSYGIDNQESESVCPPHTEQPKIEHAQSHDRVTIPKETPTNRQLFESAKLVANLTVEPSEPEKPHKPETANRTARRKHMDLVDLHAARLLIPDTVSSGDGIHLVFERAARGANNIYLKIINGKLAHYYVFTKNAAVIRKSKCYVINSGRNLFFFVHLTGVSSNFRQLYKVLIGTLGHNEWLPLKPYENAMVLRFPVPTRLHYEVLQKVTNEHPDSILA